MNHRVTYFSGFQGKATLMLSDQIKPILINFLKTLGCKLFSYKISCGRSKRRRRRSVASCPKWLSDWMIFFFHTIVSKSDLAILYQSSYQQVIPLSMKNQKGALCESHISTLERLGQLWFRRRTFMCRTQCTNYYNVLCKQYDLSEHFSPFEFGSAELRSTSNGLFT